MILVIFDLMISIEHASLRTLTPEELQRAYDLLIYAYAMTEKEIWGESYKRLSQEEFTELIDSGAIYIARDNGEVAGSIGVFQMDENTFNFGLLNADFSKKGKGIGRKLIAAAEEHALKNGASFMALEILRASEIEVASKQMLDQWYRSLGYKFTESMSFEDRKPDKAEKALKMVNPSQFDCYRKDLKPQ